MIKKNKPDLFSLGDILVEVNSWECNRNVKFFQITKINRCSIIIRKIDQKETKFKKQKNSGMYTSKVEPIKDSYISNNITTKITENNFVRISSTSWATKWDGKPEEAKYD